MAWKNSFQHFYLGRGNITVMLLCFIEEWRKKLDSNFVVGAILTDLSKAFDSVKCPNTEFFLVRIQENMDQK